jgi:hypothetical protein
MKGMQLTASLDNRPVERVRSAQFVHGGPNLQLNTSHIVALSVWQGGLNPGDHNDDRSYRHYLHAEMSNGRVHELGWWKEKDAAWKARQELMKQISEGDLAVLRVDSDTPRADRPELVSASVHWELEAQIAEAVDSLKSIVIRLDK